MFPAPEELLPNPTCSTLQVQVQILLLIARRTLVCPLQAQLGQEEAVCHTQLGFCSNWSREPWRRDEILDFSRKEKDFVKRPEDEILAMQESVKEEILQLALIILSRKNLECITFRAMMTMVWWQLDRCEIYEGWRCLGGTASLDDRKIFSQMPNEQAPMVGEITMEQS